MIKMSQHTIYQKFKPASSELIWSFVSESTLSIIKDSENPTNRNKPEVTNLHGIKYFNLTDTIYGFSKLQPNWDTYNADSISTNAIETAIEILNHIYSKGLLSNDTNINIFPMRDGGIQFEFDADYICAELEINQSGESIFVLFNDDGDIIKKWQIFELSELTTLIEDAQYAY